MKKFIYTFIMLILMGVFVYSLYNVYTIYSEYNESDKTYEELVGDISEQESEEVDATQEKKEEQSEVNLKIDFAKLQKVNKDVIGWIYNPGTVINYPVVQGKDNSYYLKHLINGKENPSGTPFLDYHMKPDFSDKNMFIYAHHMKNGSMFSSITEYKDMAYYNKHKNMYLITPDKKYRLEVFSAYITKATSDTYMRGFKANDKFQKYIDYITELSLIKTGIEVTKDDTIVSLSTCTYEYKNARFVVHTKRVEIK